LATAGFEALTAAGGAAGGAQGAAPAAAVCTGPGAESLCTWTGAGNGLQARRGILPTPARRAVTGQNWPSGPQRQVSTGWRHN